MWKKLGCVGVAVGLVGLGACSSGGSGGDDDGVLPGLADASTGGPDTGGGGDIDAAVVGDGNDSFGDAQDVTVGNPTGVPGVIQQPSDKDFFKFEGTAGTFYSIVTVSNPMDDLDLADTVIRVYDASMTQIAENDDAVPRISTDSEVIVRMPASGTVYIEVLEFSDWAGETPEGDGTYTYNVVVAAVDAALQGVVADTEAGDDTASAVEVEFNQGAGVVVGDFNDAGDVDVYRVTVGLTMGGVVFSSAIAPDGADGYGSTTAPARVTLMDATGTTVLARIEPGAGPFELSPPVEQNASYLVFIEHDGATGANPFYVYKFFLGAANPVETETAAGQNDTAATAQALASQEGSHFIRSQLTTAGDVDYYSVSATAGQTISVACAAARVGSGVRGLHAELRTPADAVLAMRDESLTADMLITDAPAATAGTYFLRLSKTGQDADVTSNFVRCGVHVRDM